MLSIQEIGLGDMRHSYKDTRDRISSYYQAKFHKYGEQIDQEGHEDDE
jgi:hypothetical protein